MTDSQIGFSVLIDDDARCNNALAFEIDRLSREMDTSTYQRNAHNKRKYSTHNACNFICLKGVVWASQIFLFKGSMKERLENKGQPIFP